MIAVASSALFDLTESHAVYTKEGPQAYERYQDAHLDVALQPGVAFPFVSRFLAFNRRFPRESPVEVVLLSRNSAATGLRVFRSIKQHGLGISRAAFTEGQSPFPYIPAFKASLFLSANEGDVQAATAAGYPAGLVLPGRIENDTRDEQLRVAFDFDGVIADDESETVYSEQALAGFIEHEVGHVKRPHAPGPLAMLIQRLAHLRKLEDEAMAADPAYRRCLRTAIVTARSAPAHERMVTTLKHFSIHADDVFMLGGMSKRHIFSVLRPHIFFDDQRMHLEDSAGELPMVHIPFGVRNRTIQQ